MVMPVRISNGWKSPADDSPPLEMKSPASSGAFRKGDPRINRRGRPRRELAIPEILRTIGREWDPRTKREKIETLMRRIWAQAELGESWAVQFIADRTEGKVKDTLHLEGGQTLELVEEIRDATPADPPAPDA
jgi:hypothetical protein